MILHRQPVRHLALVAAFLPLIGCGGVLGSAPQAKLGQTKPAQAMFGYAVADEPQAALVARQILAQGGNAADAAAAAGFALSVTLPSRGGLGGGGACIARMPDAKGRLQPPVALLFPPGPPASGGKDRPAAVPALARGLLALQARYGALPYSSVVLPAERLAAGVPVSPALAADLQVVDGALLADPAAAMVFARPDGTPLRAGDNLAQPDLAATLERLRTQGVQGFYAGDFPQDLVAAANQAGADLSVTDLAATLPRFTAPTPATEDGYRLAWLPSAGPPAKGPLPASAGFATLDRNGGTVACAVTMNNLFGTGRIAPGTGILLAASPRVVPAPVLAAGIAYDSHSKAFRAAVTGTGQAAAAAAAEQGMYAALHNTLAKVPEPGVREPGRANIISCPRGVPGGEASCTASADPRGFGLAVGGK